MANRLQKLALTSYTPGTPYKPATPAYYTTTRIFFPTTAVVLRYQVVVANGKTRYIPIYETVPAHYEYVRTYHPAEPSVPGVPSSLQYTAILDWNGGGRSYTAMAGDGAYEFKVSGGASGVVVGLAGDDSTPLPTEQSHAFYIHGTRADTMESGIIVDTDVITHDSDVTYRIERVNGQVSYVVDGYRVTSPVPSYGPVYLDASLYASGDAVLDPVLLAVYRGYATGSLAPLWGRGGKANYASADGHLPRLTGFGSGRELIAAAGSLRPLVGQGADRPYGSATGTLGALTGDGNGGFPQLTIATGQGALAILSGTAHGLTGEVGNAEGTLGALVGQGADRPYGAAVGTLKALTGVAYPRLQFGRRTITSPLTIGQVFDYDYPHKAKITSTLLLQSGVSGQQSTHVTFGSVLLLGSSVTGRYDVSAAISSRLLLGSRVRGANTANGLDEQLLSEPVQLAVNTETGAVSEYVGYDYLQFARVGQQLYAVRPDGLYLLGEEPEEGLPWRVDFGAGTLGNNRTKFMTDLYFGVETDGGMIASVDTGNTRYDYRVIQRRDPIMRCRLNKGVRGRVWGIQVEGHDATYLELDSVEMIVDQAKRFWAGR